MEDDYILFRMRVEGDPSQGAAFGSRHWNVLFDIDGDGYKEYWVDLDGAFSSGPGNDRIQILYDDANRQNIDDPDVSRVEEFTAFYDPDGDASCSASSPGLSHTRVVPTTDGSGDYWIEMQIPMTAFNDDNGNQLLYPDSPIAFVFSTSASNTDPLQKDFMKDFWTSSRSPTPSHSATSSSLTGSPESSSRTRVSTPSSSTPLATTSSCGCPIPTRIAIRTPLNVSTSP